MSSERGTDGVLVVEDDTEIRETLVELLEAHGYAATAAANGLEALRRLRDEALNPCMILLDLMMPVMNGAAFRAEQRRDPALAGIPVVVLSAYADGFADMDRTGVKHFLRKPVSLDTLLSAVEEEC